MADCLAFNIVLFDTSVDISGAAPLPSSKSNILGTDDVKRDVLARVIWVSYINNVHFGSHDSFKSLGILAGAVQGYFEKNRFILSEICSKFGVRFHHIIIILFAILGRSFWLLVLLTVLFGWMGLVGVVRAEFLRARNLEYVTAAKALGVSNFIIMFRHMLPNAMVATLTLMPFIVTGTIATLASLDFLGFGLPASAPSLGELTLQANKTFRRRS